MSNLLLKSGSNLKASSNQKFWESQPLTFSKENDSSDLLGRGYGDDSKNIVMNSLDMDDIINEDEQHDFIDQNKISIMKSGVKTEDSKSKAHITELDEILQGGSNSQIKIEGLEKEDEKKEDSGENKEGDNVKEKSGQTEDKIGGDEKNQNVSEVLKSDVKVSQGSKEKELSSSLVKSKE